MITLTQAFKLCNVRDDEVVFLQKRADQPDFGCWGYALSGIKTRQKYDMKHTMVSRIRPHFSFGAYEGIEFTVTHNNTLSREGSHEQREYL